MRELYLIVKQDYIQPRVIGIIETKEKEIINRIIKLIINWKAKLIYNCMSNIYIYKLSEYDMAAILREGLDKFCENKQRLTEISL